VALTAQGLDVRIDNERDGIGVVGPPREAEPKDLAIDPGGVHMLVLAGMWGIEVQKVALWAAQPHRGVERHAPQLVATVAAVGDGKGHGRGGARVLHRERAHADIDPAPRDAIAAHDSHLGKGAPARTASLRRSSTSGLVDAEEAACRRERRIPGDTVDHLGRNTQRCDPGGTRPAADNLRRDPGHHVDEVISRFAILVAILVAAAPR
jgi:hypothetical protein